jgi:hypothetical protein
MIAETTFSKSYSSFWQEHLPWLNDYVHTVARDSSRESLKSIKVIEDAEYRAINNVMAFTLFKNTVNDIDRSFDVLFSETKNILKWVPRNNLQSYVLNDLHKSIITFQSEQLIARYGFKNSLFYPRFSGCGILMNCNGDLLVDNCLSEIKAGVRQLAPSDFRQLIIYAALDWIAGSNYKIDLIELFNPRQNIFWSESIDIFIKVVSGETKEELFENIGQFLTYASEESII